MKKKRTKKHSAHSRYVKVTRAVIKGLGVVWHSAGDGKCSVVDMHTSKAKPATETLYHALEGVAYKWTVLIAVICKTPQGERYMKCEQIETGQPYRQSEIAEYLNDKHQALFSTQNRKHVQHLAWLALPYQSDIDEEQAFNIFEKQEIAE